MSSGRLVVVDRLGRDAKAFPVRSGSASIGSDPACDVRVLLPAARALHATLAVRPAAALLRALGRTTLNGRAVSVAALRHGDTLGVAGRRLRWEYDRPRARAPGSPAPAALAAASPRARSPARRRSSPARRAAPRAPHRDSAPAAAAGKQVAVVQPQRRDAADADARPRCDPRPGESPASARGPRPPDSLAGASPSARKSGRSESPGPASLDDPTKATLWIESRKTRSPRNFPKLDVSQKARNSQTNVSASTAETPRLARKRASNVSIATHRSVSKIPRISANTRKSSAASLAASSADSSRESPRESPHVSPRMSPRVSHRESLRGGAKSAPLRLAVLKKAHSAQHRVTKIQAPLKIDHTKQAAIMLMTGHAARSPGASPGGPAGVSPSARAARGPSFGVTPKRICTYRTETKESVKKSPVGGRRSIRQTIRSPTLTSPKKSAMKNPKTKTSFRKTESIKFDLSNLDSSSNLEIVEQHTMSDVILADSTEDRSRHSVSEDDITLHYSDTSSTKSPSPKKTIHSRSSRIIEKTLGSPMQTPVLEYTPQSPRSKRSFRGSMIVQKALSSSSSRYSRRTTKSVSDQSYSTTITSRMSVTLSPRSRRNLESYSLVDLVSIDSNDSGRSIYNSVDSKSTGSFGTPRTIASRQARSKNPSIIESSMPHSKKSLSPNTNNSDSANKIVSDKSSISTRRSACMTTPENAQNLSFKSTRIPRRSRSRSRVNDSDLILVGEDGNEDSSPKSSRRSNKSILSPIVGKNISITMSPSDSPTTGTVTPENRHSPQDIGTPMLSIQSLLDQSCADQTSKPSQKPRILRSNVKRITIGGPFVEPKMSRLSVKSRSLNLTQRRSLRARKTCSSFLRLRDSCQDIEGVATPKSAVKLVQEGVKNKHSTAKKPQSKRSLIDDLDDSHLVKELFNSPVKRNLSQSMTEFSRKQLFDEDDVAPSRPTRNTIAAAGRTPDDSFFNHTRAFTPEAFVSPLSTPGRSPDLAGVKRLFGRNTPRNDLSDVRGVKTLLRTPRARTRSGREPPDISGVKKIFRRSPKNRLSDVRVKEIFAPSPDNDLRRVSGVKTLFRISKNAPEDVRGVKNLFRRSPRNDLRNVSGVKRTLRANSPRNDLTDVRGVRRLYRESRERNDIGDVSGVEELFLEPPSPSPSPARTLGRVSGGPRPRAYTAPGPRARARSPGAARALHRSIGLITDDVEAWLESELRKRVRAPGRAHAPSGPRQQAASELYSARKLPIKKRSLARGATAGELLPLKKRPVLHSTPVKGRDVTMNASELGRVSPIVSDDSRTLQRSEGSQKPKAARGRKPDAAKIDPSGPAVAEPAAKRTRGKVPNGSERTTPRVTRGKKLNDDKTTTKKGPPSKMIAKQTPTVIVTQQSPKATRAKKGQNKEIIAQNSPKKVRSTRQKNLATVSPKKTRAKVVKAVVVVSKPSPMIKPRSKRNAAIASENIEEEKPKRTRNASGKKKTMETKSKKSNVTETKTKKKGKEPTEVKAIGLIEPSKPKRGRKIAVENETKVEDNINVPAKKRGRKPKQIPNDNEPQTKQTAKTVDPKKSTRGRKAAVTPNTVKSKKLTIVTPSPVKKLKSPVKKAKFNAVDNEPRKSRRGAKDKQNANGSVASEEKPEKKTRVSRRAAAEPVTGGRTTRKTISEEETKPAKIKKAPAARKRPAGDHVADSDIDSKKTRSTRGASQVSLRPRRR